ncbi:nucleoside triphosphate pyrophosphatase [Nocardioides sp.]|jgi:septum formation protein|uniref:Maf family protein n=1 Tax=Nocardioides sp. TaxID=35761 RepID=UPI002630088D|nr:nucleoside triphosphate pyrophosphatase [Nocardioides sp.]
MTSLVLASQSPARLATLRRAGIEPTVIVSGVDEDQLSGLEPAALALELSTLKARAVLAHRELPKESLVLGCDSVLELDGEALGKPHTPEIAVERWRAMRGRSADLVSGHTLIDATDGRTERAFARTTVHFADISDAEIAAYVATGEPLEVAGAFTVDGLGGAFITGIEGDFHNVVGVSLPLVRELTVALGYRWPSLWSRSSEM